MEKWDVYDIHKNKLKNRGTIHSTEELLENEYNLVTVSWIYNTKGEFLMQKRAANKRYPFVYANHGGRAHAGETSKESMIRELEEEIGIMVNEDELVLLRTFNDHESIFDEYIVLKDIALNELIIDKREVASCEWFTIEELSSLIDKGECFDYRTNNHKGIGSLEVITTFLMNRS